jgi:hypothetical protein
MKTHARRTGKKRPLTYGEARVREANKKNRVAKKRRASKRKPRNLRALRATGARTHKRARFYRCANRDIRAAVNVSGDPTQRKEALAFLRKCYRQIKPSVVGKRGGISRGNYISMLRKLGKGTKLLGFLQSNKKRTMFENAGAHY